MEWPSKSNRCRDFKFKLALESSSLNSEGGGTVTLCNGPVFTC